MLDIVDSYDILDYCTTLFSFTDVPIAERVADTQKICNLSAQNTKISVTQSECFVNIVKRAYAYARSMEELEQTLSLFTCLTDLDILEEVARRSSSFAYRLLSAKVLFWSLPRYYRFSSKNCLFGYGFPSKISIKMPELSSQCQHNYVKTSAFHPKTYLF